MTDERQVCTCCGKLKKLDDYYASASPFHKHSGKLHVCKECIWSQVGDDVENINLITNTLRRLDKPFKVSLWQSSIDEAIKVNKNIFKIYMKNLGLAQNRESTWDDSDFEGHKKAKSTNNKELFDEININDDIQDLTEDELKYLKTLWGKGYELDDLFWLQSEYEDWTNRYECDSKGMETLIQEICKQQLDINIRRSNGEKVDQQLKTLQDLLGSSNLKPVQETGANAVEQESFGTLIKKYENEKPIPEPEPQWKDVDGISKYIKVFFLGHLSRMLGIKNDYENEYWEEINKYTVDEPIEDEEDGDENVIT